MLNSSMATTRDKHFIIGCVLSGSKRGRFTQDAYIPVSMRNIRSEIHSILHSNRTLRGDRAFALIYKRCGKHAGVAIIASDPAGTAGPALYAMAVSPGNRGKGYGPMIIDAIYSRYLAGDYCDGRYGSAVAVRKLRAQPDHVDHHVALNAPAQAESYQKAA